MDLGCFHMGGKGSTVLYFILVFFLSRSTRIVMLLCGETAGEI